MNIPVQYFTLVNLLRHLKVIDNDQFIVVNTGPGDYIITLPRGFKMSNVIFHRVAGFQAK